MKCNFFNSNRTRKNFNFLSLLFLASLLFSCSPEDDDTPVDPGGEETVQTGVFIDSEVAGLNYTTPTQSGTTNSKGEFKYLDGELVTFSVGDIALGSAEASSVMSPVKIASTSNASVASLEVLNIAAFLQSLDADNDPSNGITIEAGVADAISVAQIDFTQSITKILGDIVAEVNEATGSNLVPVYPNDAGEHLSESLGEPYESQDFAFEYFIPTLETYNSIPRTAIYWVHETDESGKLLKSYKYERRPNRLIHEITYHTYNEFGQPTSFDRVYSENGVIIQSVRVQVAYAEDHQIEAFSYHAPADGPASSTEEFVAFDEENRVTEMHYYDHNGNFILREVYVLNEAGNKISETRYSTKTGTNEEDVLVHMQYEYNEAGEIKKQYGTDARGYQEFDFFYRADHTLEKSVRILVKNDGNQREDIYFYDENEEVTRLEITEGDYVSEYISFFENGDPHVVETYYKEFLYEIITFSEDGSSIWKTISEDDNSYKLEYKDADGNIYKTEFYDANGNLLSTT
ncbi:hypothetical protein [Salinimicrobium sp. GXAS 041]|uniref:hypothetical protein n=1 Tax=Salinimicrobium sp. GXAS 041 TaxID=3400806 RepID=UPI003C764990